MSDLQKNVEKLLKENKKTKRELALFLGIKENSINRTLKSRNMAISKVEKIAEFLDMEASDLIAKKQSYVVDDPSEGYHLISSERLADKTIHNLSEAIMKSSITLQKMAETENNHSKNYENLVKLLTDKYSKPD
jgi:transcriptional regulator with XRE-family HTH domain